jgi:hypothetical protein
MSATPNPSSPKKEAAPAKEAAKSSGERVTINTADSAAQDPTLAGRLLLLRRVLLTAVEIIEDIALPKTGGTP